ncbi:AfsR/SARP family transcriptional regulator [Arthrobacter sp. SAFR-023]
MGNGGYGDFHLGLCQSWQLLSGADAVHVPTRQQRLITALAVKGPRPRNYLAGLLWPEHSDGRAMESLRVSVHLVNRQMPGLLSANGAVLSLSEVVEVDLHRIRWRILQLGEAGLNGNASACLHDLRQADLLPGWYEDWIVVEQARLRQDRLHAMVFIARESLARSEYEVALEASEAALELEPLYERAVGLQIQAEQLQGNTVSALRAFERYQALLKSDTGLAPSEAVRRLLDGV